MRPRLATSTLTLLGCLLTGLVAVPLPSSALEEPSVPVPAPLTAPRTPRPARHLRRPRHPQLPAAVPQ